MNRQRINPENSQAETQIGAFTPPSSQGAGDGAESRSGRAFTDPGSLPRVRYFGTYELLEEIARGGMGVVYKARQNRLNRTVAVKVILSGQLASDLEVKRFLVEAEAAANLSHPGIVPVYEFGEYEGTHYFSMAYVDGPSLAQKAADTPLDPEEAVALVSKITEAVAYAHSEGVIHRDLKPGNILLEGGNVPRIADFGLAKRVGEDSDLTHSGTVMGSTFYMPPEQADGRVDDVGTLSDVYSLGAILYKLLTGRPPFQAATNYETIQQVLNEEPVRPRVLNPAIPKDLETICLKCLEKDPRRRYSSATAFREELDRYENGLPIQARPIGRLARLGRWCRRNPLPAGLGTGLVVVVIIGTVSATLLWTRARTEQRRTEYQRQVVAMLSDMVLDKTLDETEEWLRLFFKPVEQELLVAREWGLTGFLEKRSPDSLNKLLVPIIRHYPQVSSLMVADDLGREHMLLSIESDVGASGTSTRQWRNRITRRDEWGDRVEWRQWLEGEPIGAPTDENLPDYDPRLRPWFRGAVERMNVGDVVGRQRLHWTAPYVFFTTKDLGITASIAFEPGDGRTHVVGFDVLLQDITAFTSSKRPTENGKVLVLTESMEMIGLPADPALQTPASWKEAFLKNPSALGLEVVADGVAQFAFAPGAASGFNAFESGGQSWRAGLRPFRLGTERQLWILVLLPERDLRRGLTETVDETEVAVRTAE